MVLLVDRDVKRTLDPGSPVSTQTGVEFGRDMASGERPVGVVAVRAHVRWFIRKSLAPAEWVTMVWM